MTPRNLPHLILLLVATLSACAGRAPATGQATPPPQAQAQQTPEEALRGRATQFWEARVKGDLAVQYEFLEPKAKEQMTLTGFVRSRGAFIFLSYQIEGVEVAGDEGRVVGKATFRMNLPQLAGLGPWTQPATTSWIREGGVWYLKGSQRDVDQPVRATGGQP